MQLPHYYYFMFLQVCEENYVKHCNIMYRKVAMNETYTHCYKPLVKDCTAKPGTNKTRAYTVEYWPLGPRVVSNISSVRKSIR